MATLLASCSSDGPSFRPVEAWTPTGGTRSGGDAVAPAPGVRGGQSYLFRDDRPPVAMRPESARLSDLVADIEGIGTRGLRSTEDAAALIVIEDSPGTPWGTLVSEAQRTIFTSFSDDEKMGGWLVLVTDVVVHGSADPVPATGYRWTRDVVNRYVACGIPATGTNECKSTFFRAAEQVVLHAQGYVNRSR